MHENDRYVSAGAQNTKQPSRSSRQSKGSLTPDTKLRFSTREAHSSSNQASRRSMMLKPQTEPHNFRKQTKSNRLASHPHPSSPDEIDTRSESVGTRARRLRAIRTSRRKIKVTWRSVSQETRCRTLAFSCGARSAFRLNNYDYLRSMLSRRQLQGFVMRRRGSFNPLLCVCHLINLHFQLSQSFWIWNS